MRKLIFLMDNSTSKHLNAKMLAPAQTLKDISERLDFLAKNPNRQAAQELKTWVNTNFDRTKSQIVSFLDMVKDPVTVYVASESNPSDEKEYTYQYGDVDDVDVLADDISEATGFQVERIKRYNKKDGEWVSLDLGTKLEKLNGQHLRYVLSDEPLDLEVGLS